MAEINQPKAARTVTVACNLPHGVVLQGCVEETVREPVIGGGMRDVKQFRKAGERFAVKGNAIPMIRDPGVAYPEIANGYALTHGVPAELWEVWLRDNKDSAMVVNRCIFAVERDAAGEAKRAGEQRSGLEPLSQAGDPRMPRRRSLPIGGLSDVTQSDRPAA